MPCETKKRKKHKIIKNTFSCKKKEKMFEQLVKPKRMCDYQQEQHDVECCNLARKFVLFLCRKKHSHDSSLNQEISDINTDMGQPKN